MRSRIVYFFIYSCVLLSTACQESTPPKSHHISIAIDQSETSIEIPPASFFVNKLKKTDIFDGISLSLLPIGETRFEATEQFLLEPEHRGWLSNEDERRKKRKSMIKQFSDAVEVHRNASNNLRKSDIYRVVAQELNRLAQQKGIRTLYLCSNLKENSSLISFYDTQQTQTLYQHPKVIQQLFEQAVPLTDLSGVTLHILHTPSIEEAELFEHLVGLYKSLVESKGGVVTVGYHHRISM